METLEQSPPKQPKRSSALRSKTTKPPQVVNEVIIRRAMGQSRNMIAKDLGIAQNTVTSIVALENIDQLIQDGRLSVARLIPKSVNVLDQRLDKGSESAATTILSGIGVLKSKQDVNINVAAVTSSSWYQRRNPEVKQIDVQSVSNGHVLDKE